MGVTMQQVAEMAGVSKATVSRVLNGLGVKAETEHKVKQVMEKLQYRPHRFARGLASHTTGFLGVVTPSLNPFVAAVLTGMEDEARRHGKLITLGVFSTDDSDNREAIRALTDPPVVDGLLFFLPTLSMESLIRTMAQKDFPLVVASERRFENLVSSVIIDNFNGAKQAVDYLIGKGHRRIGFITGWTQLSDSQDRQKGYEQALRDAGIRPEPSLVLQGNYTIPSGEEAARKFLSMPYPPTAVFAANDAMAIGVLKVLETEKREKAFAVMGFDDIEMAAFVRPALTTVGYNLFELGSQAVHKLMQRVRGEEKICSTLQLKTHLIIRDSA